MNRGDSPVPQSAADGWPATRFDVALFAGLAFATAAFSRDFAWLHLSVYTAWPYLRVFAKPRSDSFAVESATSGLPIFVTEAVLGLLILQIARRKWRDDDPRRAGSPWLDRLLLLWLLVGLYDLARGLGSGATLALRDFALVYYAAFLYIARAVCDTGKHLSAVCLAYWLGTVVSLSGATLWYVDPDFLPQTEWPARGDFLAGSYGVYFMVAVLAALAVWPHLGRTGKRILYVYASVATFALVLPQQRSLIIAFVAGSLALLVGRAAGAVTALPLWRLGVGAAVAALILEIARLGIGGSAQFVDPVWQLVSKSGGTAVVAKPSADGATATGAGDDRHAANGAMAAAANRPDTVHMALMGTARFRQDAWGEAWARFRDQPLLGEGFGKPFFFYDVAQRRWWTDDVRPHNMYLTILYKMGVVGFAAFLLLNAAFYRDAWRGLRRPQTAIVRASAIGLLSALVGVQVYGFFNLLVESPFLAVVYWSLMGLIGAVLRLEVTEPQPPEPRRGRSELAAGVSGNVLRHRE